MRNVSISGARSSREQLASMEEALDSNNDQEQPQQQEQQQLNKTSQVALKDAMLQSGGRLNVDHRPKPRSKSLIWRPHRKSSRMAPNDSSDCRVS